MLVIDALGRKCPIPIIMLAERIREVPIGETIAVLADDPAAKTDVPAWCTHEVARVRRAHRAAPRLVAADQAQLLTALAGGLPWPPVSRAGATGSGQRTGGRLPPGLRRRRAVPGPGATRRRARRPRRRARRRPPAPPCSSSRIIWISMAARNGRPTRSPRSHSAPPPITWSARRLGPHGRAERAVVGPGDEVLVGHDGQAEDRVPDHLRAGDPQGHQVGVGLRHRIDPQQRPEEHPARRQQRQVGQFPDRVAAQPGLVPGREVEEEADEDHGAAR